MTIAEKLYESDPDTLFKIIVRYQLADLVRMYFPNKIKITRPAEEKPSREYERLMQPGEYSGRTERRRGAIVQPYRPVIK